MVCPHCRTPNPEGTSICFRCSTPFGLGEVTLPVIAPPDPGATGPDHAAPGYPDEPGHDPEVSALSGMDLIQHTLGGQVIEEFGDA